MGRGNRYESHVKPRLSEIAEWYKTETEGEIVRRLGVSRASFEKYKTIYPELRDALLKGKQELVADLKDSLKKKAQGFRYTETKKTIRQVDGKKTQVIEEFDRYSPPDTGAIHLLLKNLDPTWRNEDFETMRMKKEELELKRQRGEW